MAGLHMFVSHSTAKFSPFHGWFALCTSGSVSHNTAGFDIGIPFTRQGRVRYLGLFHTTRIWHHRLSLSVRAVSLCVSVCAGAHAREQIALRLSRNFARISLVPCGGLGLHGLLLICCYAFRFESLRSLGACQIPENNPRFSSILLQHRRSKSSTSSSKGFFLCFRPERERERERERRQL